MANFASTKRPQHVLQQRPQPHALQQLHHVIHVNIAPAKTVLINNLKFYFIILLNRIHLFEGVCQNGQNVVKFLLINLNNLINVDIYFNLLKCQAMCSCYQGFYGQFCQYQ